MFGFFHHATFIELECTCSTTRYLMLMCMYEAAFIYSTLKLEKKRVCMVKLSELTWYNFNIKSTLCF